MIDPVTRLRKLDFLIAGAQKCGTTALAQYLDQHADIYLPPTKELHYFKRLPDQPRAGDLQITDDFAPARPNQICAEATPIYLYWPGSLEHIRDHNPDIKLVISLRHPALRAYSGWSMERRRNREPLEFSEAIREGRERVSSAPGGVHLIHSYVERGFYAAQIQHALTLFPREQIYFMRSDHIQSDHPAMSGLVQFLGLEPQSFTAIQGNVFPSSLPASPQDLQVDMDYLQRLYASDMSLLSALTGLDITDWLAKPATL